MKINHGTASITLAFALSLGALPAFSQHAPYAGQQERQIKSLSQKDVDDLLAGQGMGLAKAAELNGYPGPAHVLEHAAALALNDTQRESTEALMRAHKTRARTLGSDLVTSERDLDRAFAQGSIDKALLAKLTADIGRKQAELREEHLRTHLEQTALLTKEQVHKYAELRGYTGAPVPGAVPAHQPKHH
jgi:hypothetical protein